MKADIHSMELQERLLNLSRCATEVSHFDTPSTRLLLQEASLSVEGEEGTRINQIDLYQEVEKHRTRRNLQRVGNFSMPQLQTSLQDSSRIGEGILDVGENH